MEKRAKNISIKSMPATTLELLLANIEKHFNIKKEIDVLIVSL